MAPLGLLSWLNEPSPSVLPLESFSRGISGPLGFGGESWGSPHHSPGSGSRVSAAELQRLPATAPAVAPCLRDTEPSVGVSGVWNNCLL